jgi:uncharacterized oligopeptide transporter (OPT) family protein
MAMVVDGILTQKLPWGLILIGAFLAIAVEVLGIPSLPVAVGVYLPISTSATMFMGGVVRWLVEHRMTSAQRAAEGDSGPGVLFGSGLIAGGAILGIVIQSLGAFYLSNGKRTYGQAIDLSSRVGAFSHSSLAAILLYVALLAIPFYLVARRSVRRDV